MSGGGGGSFLSGSGSSSFNTPSPFNTFRPPPASPSPPPTLGQAFGSILNLPADRAMAVLKPRVPTLGETLGGVMGLPVTKAMDALSGAPMPPPRSLGFGTPGIDWNQPMPPPRPQGIGQFGQGGVPLPLARPSGYSPSPGANAPLPLPRPITPFPPQRPGGFGYSSGQPFDRPGTGAFGGLYPASGQVPYNYNPKAYDSPESSSAKSEMIRREFSRTGQDPELARKVAAREGFNNYVGDSGSSFGPFQLHMGGLAPGRNSGPGLGDVFKKETGLDPRNPATVPRQIKWVADYTAKHGWDAFHGARGGMRNISGSMSDFGANLPAQAAPAASEDANALVQQHGGDINRAVDDAMTKQGENALVNRQDLEDYMRTGGHDLDPQKSAYCAAFIGAALEHAGIPSMHSNVATSYLNWGKPATGGIQKGDVLVISRGHAAGETGGHVGIATGRTNSAGQVEMIAGNTGGIRRGRSVATSFVNPRSVTARRYDPSSEQAGGRSTTQPGPSAGSGLGTDAEIAAIEKRLAGMDEQDQHPSLAKMIGKAAKDFAESQKQIKPYESEPQQSDDSSLRALEAMVEQGSQSAQQQLGQSVAAWNEHASHLLDAPQIQSPEQLANLKPGQAFRDPRGVLRFYMPQATRSPSQQDQQEA